MTQWTDLPDSGHVNGAVLVGWACAFGVVAQHLFVGEPAGLNLVVAIALLLAIAWRIRRPGTGLGRRDTWLPAGALALAAFTAVRADPVLLVFDILAASGLALLTLSALAGTPVHALIAPALVREFALVAWRAASAGTRVVIDAWPVVSVPLKPRARDAMPYVAGLILAIPFVALFSTLFAAADTVFANTLRDLIDVRRWLDVFSEVPGRLLLGAIAAWCAAGALAHARMRPREVAPRSRGRLGHQTLTVMLVAVDLVFVYFVLIQATYLFGGRDTLDTAGMTYSAYARRGFFELVVAATIVGGLVFGVGMWARTRERAMVCAALALLALTLVVLASATYRMDLYQRAYGWTELRLYVFAMIAFLAIAIAVLADALLRDRMERSLQAAMMGALAVVIALNLIGPADHVARANVSRQLDPSGLPVETERTLDIWNLASLGDGAVPSLVAVLPRLDERDRSQLACVLRLRLERLATTRPGWQGWNLERETARVVLEGARDALPPLEVARLGCYRRAP